MTAIIVGHRGVKGHYPENTQVSIQAAIDLGLTWVEVDIQPSKDGVLVLCHNHTVTKCSNGRGRVDSFTLEELKKLDFGSKFDAKFAGEPIMTLAQLLSLAVEHDINLNLEVKVDKQDVAAVVNTLKQQLDQSPIRADQIMLSSFDHPMIRQLHHHCPGYRLAVLSDKLNDADRALLAEVDAFSCNLNQRKVKESDINELHAQGYQVWCYTVNDPQAFKWLNLVDGIFTDFPERFI